MAFYPIWKCLVLTHIVLQLVGYGIAFSPEGNFSA